MSVGVADITTGMQRGALGGVGLPDGWNEMKGKCMTGLGKAGVIL